MRLQKRRGLEKKLGALAGRDWEGPRGREGVPMLQFVVTASGTNSASRKRGGRPKRNTGGNLPQRTIKTSSTMD